MPGTLYITGDPDADALLNTDRFALLVGMLLDQQVSMEWAFRGPATLEHRLGHFDARYRRHAGRRRGGRGPQKPAVHRFPVAMARRLHDLAVFVTEHYGGDTAAIWTTARTGQELYRRLRELPGFGDEKAKIFIALLAKRLRRAPAGVEGAAGVFADATPRPVADCAEPRVAGPGAAVEDGAEGGPEGQAGPPAQTCLERLTLTDVGHAWPSRPRHRRRWAGGARRRPATPPARRW